MDLYFRRYIYDNKGVEIHCLKNHERPYRLDFLPYHFLLTSVGHSGWIKWQDVSTGTYVILFLLYLNAKYHMRQFKLNIYIYIYSFFQSGGWVQHWKRAL